MKLFGRINARLAALGDNGAVAIEFAIVVFAFRLMLLASFEFGYMLFVQSVLDMPRATPPA